MLPTSLLPPLALAEWEATKITLHLYMQIVGKIQLKLNPPRNHWWHVSLYPCAKGISSQQIPCGDKTLEILFNFISHRLEIQTSAGEYEEILLQDGLSVAEFYHQLFNKLQKVDVRVRILAKPFSMNIDKPFTHITEHHSYQKTHIESFWKILLWTSGIFKQFCSRFQGKTCPVQLYWHHMDLALTRFSGRRAPELPRNAHKLSKETYSHEFISFGLLPGDEHVHAAAYYAYAYPSPKGISHEPLQPPAAQWVVSNGTPLALLMYSDLRTHPDPEGALLAFLESSFQAGAKCAGWEQTS
ncbi:DUF5996 family protein [Cesiribacter sp. SM1]|uniref:DUF5996 family protein n=1 Tax=Cesiribacter sp. SM1 TaxID=2861196 RepID=UPI001CD71E8E|nr:DUF5996 family protein [Cesiribacter sp. SM1]